MRTTQKSPNYVQKSILLLLLLGFISFGAIGGCSDNDSSNNTQALTENDFAGDESLRGDPEGGVIVTFLEHPNLGSDENDTNGAGADEIPLRYKRTINQTFCWEDDDSDAAHFMELIDSEGSEILRVEANGDCVTETVEAGEHLMVINHDRRLDRSQAVFIIPDRESSQLALQKQGLIYTITTAARNILGGISDSITKDAEAQSNDQSTLLSTNKCENCDLQNAELSNSDLSNADLTGADLSFADMKSVKLISANLSKATLQSADLDRADLTDVETDNVTEFTEAKMTEVVLTGVDLEGVSFTMADLSDADLSNTNLRSSALFFANLSGANMSGAEMLFASLNSSNLSNADLSGADLTSASFLDATLSNTDLTDADLSDAEWCDGCRCDSSSTGECSGCSSPDDVCTGN